MNARPAHNPSKQCDIPAGMDLPGEAFLADPYIRYVILIADWKSDGEPAGGSGPPLITWLEPSPKR